MRTRLQNLPNLARLVLLVLLSILNPQLSSFAQGTAFTYQGRLNDNGSPANGIYDLRFTIYAAASGGSVAGGPVDAGDVGVTNGLFTVTLDFGANVFTGANRWLEIGVRPGSSTGGYTNLEPRQPITATPYALTAGNVTGTISDSQLSANIARLNGNAVFTGAVVFSNAASQFTGSFAGDGAGLTTLNAGQLTSGTVSDARLAANVARTNQVWLLGGNTGAAPGANFLGTTDDQPLELRVNGMRALRLEPNATSPNVIGGYVSNSISPGIYGATIAGGGRAGLPHTVSGHHGTIGGGDANTVSGQDGTIAGGGGNFVAGGYASIGGGLFNNNLAYLGTISGGANHRIGNNANSGVIAGGFAHSIADNSYDGTIGGGSYNSIGTNSSSVTISGGRSNAVQSNASSSTIGGGHLNTIQASAYLATIGGGVFNTIQTNAVYTTIGGGYRNTIQTNAVVATIGGGQFNTIQTSASSATIGGGDQNTIQANADYATIPGGFQNSAASYAFAAGNRAKANHQGAFVWGDSQDADFASTGNNQFCIRANGGVQLSGDTSMSFGSTLGPKINLYGTAFGLGIQSGIQYSRVGVGGGFAWYAGGVHDDGTYQSGGGTTLMKLDGSQLTVNGALIAGSDRNTKENFAPVQSREMLEKVLALPLSSWNYKADTATRHVGPMAQDFYAAFNVGPDDKHIATVDADGVALAAIQGLNQKLTDELKRRDAENAELKQRLQALEKIIHNQKSN